MELFDKIKELFESKNIKYEVSEHEKVHTSEEAASVRGEKVEEGAKALIFRSEGKFYMFVIAGNERIDYKKAKEEIGKDRISMATPEEVKEVSGVEVGAVPPLGNLFNIPVYFDKSVLETEYACFSAGSHYKSIKLKSEDLKKAVEPIVGDFAK